MPCPGEAGDEAPAVVIRVRSVCRGRVEVTVRAHPGGLGKASLEHLRAGPERDIGNGARGSLMNNGTSFLSNADQVPPDAPLLH